MCQESKVKVRQISCNRNISSLIPIHCIPVMLRLKAITQNLNIIPFDNQIDWVNSAGFLGVAILWFENLKGFH